MRWKIKNRNYENWHYWFAWYPVRIDDEFVWLETILRQCVAVTEMGRYWSYTLIRPGVKK